MQVFYYCLLLRASYLFVVTIIMSTVDVLSPQPVNEPVFVEQVHKEKVRPADIANPDRDDPAATSFAIFERIKKAMEQNHVDVRERYIEHFMAKEREILSGQTLAQYHVIGNAVDGPAVARDLSLIDEWISTALEVWKSLVQDCIVPGSVEHSSLVIWHDFLSGVNRKLARTVVARHIQAHLIRVQQNLARRIRGEELDREVVAQMAVYRPEQHLSQEDNAAASWAVAMLDSDAKQQERQNIQLLEDPRCSSLMQTVFEMARLQRLPADYREYLVACAVTNQWLAGDTTHRISEVYDVRSDHPYEGFYWEHEPTSMEDVLVPANHRWFQCLLNTTPPAKVWIQNAVMHIGGAKLNDTMSIMLRVANLQLTRDLERAPVRYLFDAYVRLPFVTPATLAVLAKEMVVTPTPLPMLTELPKDARTMGMLVFAFVDSWKTRSAEEQEAQILSSDEPSVDHSEWRSWVKSTFSKGAATTK